MSSEEFTVLQVGEPVLVKILVSRDFGYVKTGPVVCVLAIDRTCKWLKVIYEGSPTWFHYARLERLT